MRIFTECDYFLFCSKKKNSEEIRTFNSSWKVSRKYFCQAPGKLNLKICPNDSLNCWATTNYKYEFYTKKARNALEELKKKSHTSNFPNEMCSFKKNAQVVENFRIRHFIHVWSWCTFHLVYTNALPQFMQLLRVLSKFFKTMCVWHVYTVKQYPGLTLKMSWRCACIQ